MLSHKKDTKKGESHTQCVRLDIYIHIEQNLIPMVVTLILIVIKIILFFMSTEISVTLEQNLFWKNFPKTHIQF